MKKIFLLFCIFTTFTFTACGQNGNDKINSQVPNNNSQLNKMDTSKLSNPTVKSAIDALQANDKTAWYNHFTADAIFTDDGRTLNLKSFFDNAFNHKEKFLTFDKIENEGKDITGNFFAGQWGTFKVFFKFHVNDEGKITRLDIGQAN